jgi:hypothetical protein
MKAKNDLKTRIVSIRIAVLLFGLMTMVSCSNKICSAYAKPEDRLLRMRAQYNNSRSPGIPTPYKSAYKAQLVKKYAGRN